MLAFTLLCAAGWVCTSVQSMAGRTAGLFWKHNVKQLISAWLSCCSPDVQVFEKFLAGDTLQDCYAAVAAVANRWLDMLDTQVCPKQPTSTAPSADMRLHSLGDGLCRKEKLASRGTWTWLLAALWAPGFKTSEPGLSDGSAVCFWLSVVRPHHAPQQGALLTSFGCAVPVLLKRVHRNRLGAGGSQVLMAVLPSGCRALT